MDVTPHSSAGFGDFPGLDEGTSPQPASAPAYSLPPEEQVPPQGGVPAGQEPTTSSLDPTAPTPETLGDETENESKPILKEIPKGLPRFALFGVVASVVLLVFGLFFAPYYGIDTSKFEKTPQAQYFEEPAVVVDGQIFHVRVAARELLGAEVQSNNEAIALLSSAGYTIHPRAADITTTAAAFRGERNVSNPSGVTIQVSTILVGVVAVGIASLFAMKMAQDHPFIALVSALGSVYALFNWVTGHLTAFQVVPVIGGRVPLYVVPLVGTELAGFGMLLLVTVAVVTAAAVLFATVTRLRVSIGAKFESGIEKFGRAIANGVRGRDRQGA